MSNLNISISAEPVLHFGHFVVSNSMLSSIIVTLGLMLFAFAFNRRLATIEPTQKPSRFQTFFEFIIEAFGNLTQTTTGNFTKARLFFPFIATFFLYIIISNWSGLLPGVGTIGFLEKAATESVFVPFLRAPTADINTTLALALFSILFVQFMGVKYVGLAYFTKFINLQSPINFFIGLLEIISEISRIISFAFRLFGNIFAGEVLLTVIAFLLPALAPLPFLLMELFVGFIQALVFSLLTLVFFNIATLSHEHE